MHAYRRFLLLPILLVVALGLSAFVRLGKNNINMPYVQSGLSKTEAAAHLLSRFTFGAKPGDIQKVVNQGLESWFSEQLVGNLPDGQLDIMLEKYDAIKLNNTQIENQFPRNAYVVRQAIKEGYINKDAVGGSDRKKYKDSILAYMRTKNYRPVQELFKQLISQKILRAAYTQNQLREVMTDFWFNHFNVAINKPQCAAFIPAYERDVIRPNVFGRFDRLLIATAKSPAMLLYLDNATSAGVNDPENSIQFNPMPKHRKVVLQKDKSKKNGLNENYAREVMELHTMGVDGGYTQNDVTQAARVLTGWTIAPMGNGGYAARTRKLINNIGWASLQKRGFVLDGDFLFDMSRHDNGEKKVLGKTFVAGRGYHEGIDLLEMLALHHSTAHFIAKKIATRFVSDNPPKSLVDKMAKVFLDKKGDIKSVLIALVNAPEFWSEAARHQKTKTPFELAISAVRAINADINTPLQLSAWITRMGQRLYYYQAPTGFPDDGQYWINTGALLNRMNFGLALASKKIPGIQYSLLAITQSHKPKSSVAALKQYATVLMPARDLAKSYERLKPLINMQALGHDTTHTVRQYEMVSPNKTNSVAKENEVLQQVLGVIIGSPAYQHR